MGTNRHGLEMKYFILKPKGNDPYSKASRAAMRQYAKSILEENPALAKDLRNWADEESIDHVESIVGSPLESDPVPDREAATDDQNQRDMREHP